LHLVLIWQDILWDDASSILAGMNLAVRL